MRLVDAHAHLWDVGRTGQTWIAQTQLPRSQKLGDHPFFARQGLRTEGFEIAGVIVVEGEPGEGCDDAEARLVAEAVLEHPGRVRGYVAPLRLGDRRVANMPRPSQIAVRDNCQRLGPEYLLSQAFRRGLVEYAEWRKPLELCLHRSQLEALAEVLDSFDEPLKVILDHAGKPPLAVDADVEAWERGLRRVAMDERVAVKLSGFYAEAPVLGSTVDSDLSLRRRLAAPFLLRTVETFGPERAIFGLDCPVSVGTRQEALAWIEDVLAVVGPDNGVFAENAERVYGIEVPVVDQKAPSERKFISHDS